MENVIIKTLRNLRYERMDMARTLLYSFVLRPTATVFPKTFLRALSWGFACVLLMVDSFGRTARTEYKAVFPDRNPWLLYLEQQSNRLYEHAWQHRVIRGLEKPSGYHFEINADESIRQLLEAPGSLVIASGHFIRGPATLALSLKEIGRRPFHIALADPPSSPKGWHERRVQVQLSVTIKAIKSWSPLGWVSSAFVGTTAFMRVLTDLRRKDCALWINVDAHWKSDQGGNVSFPFAGFRSKVFSTGAARIARMAKCPLLLMVPGMSSSDKAVLQFFGPYTSSCESADERDADITRQVLLDIERCVGERPEDYVLAMGHDRVWNSRRHCWQSNTEKASFL